METKLWNEYLVGFFLGQSISYTIVGNYFSRVWNLTDTIKVMFDTSFLQFSCVEDKQQIVKADESLSKTKCSPLFNVSPLLTWLMSMCCKFLSRFTHIFLPLLNFERYKLTFMSYQDVVCIDRSTVQHEQFEHGKAFIEVNPKQFFPSMILNLFLGCGKC